MGGTMQYASTYAMGAGQPGDGQLSASSTHEPFAPPPPARLHWSTKLFVAGMVTCFLGLVITIAGVPGAKGYDPDAPGVRSKPTSNDPLALQRSMDSNMRWIAEHSNGDAGHYVGLINSINDSEAAIPAMVQGLAAMAGSVDVIDSELAAVYAGSTKMAVDMAAMTDASATSADRMDALSGDVSALAGSMSDLRQATERLTSRMSTISGKAERIADSGTATALAKTREMNRSLPDTVPPAQVEGGGASDATAAGRAPHRDGRTQ